MYIVLNIQNNSVPKLDWFKVYVHMFIIMNFKFHRCFTFGNAKELLYVLIQKQCLFRYLIWTLEMKH